MGSGSRLVEFEFVEQQLVTAPIDTPYGQTLIRIRPGTAGFGGDPGEPEADYPLPGCVVWPGDTRENTDRADQVSADLTAICPFTADIVPTDLIVDPDWDATGWNGTDPRPLCSIIGSPSRYRNPHTGTSLLTVRLLRETG